jgi:branched-chain amino acid transport system permease protein
MNIKLEIAKQEPLWNTNKNIVRFIFFIVIFLFLLPYFNTNSFYLHLMITIFMYAAMSQSWNVVAGMSGQISLGHGAFFGLGAYSSTFLYMEYGVTPWVGIIVGIFLSSIVAILIGLSVLRLSGHYFAIATLLIGISFQVFFQRWDLVGAA